MLVERIIHRVNTYGTIEGFTEAQVLLVLKASYEQLKSTLTLIEIDVPVIVFGDIHGQLSDLKRFFSLVGTPPRSKLLFLGDYVDRCNRGIEVLIKS